MNDVRGGTRSRTESRRSTGTSTNGADGVNGSG